MTPAALTALARAGKHAELHPPGPELGGDALTVGRAEREQRRATGAFPRKRLHPQPRRERVPPRPAGGNANGTRRSANDPGPSDALEEPPEGFRSVRGFRGVGECGVRGPAKSKYVASGPSRVAASRSAPNSSRLPRTPTRGSKTVRIAPRNRRAESECDAHRPAHAASDAKASNPGPDEGGPSRRPVPDDRPPASDASSTRPPRWVYLFPPSLPRASAPPPPSRRPRTSPGGAPGGPPAPRSRARPPTRPARGRAPANPEPGPGAPPRGAAPRAPEAAPGSRARRRARPTRRGNPPRHPPRSPPRSPHLARSSAGVFVRGELEHRADERLGGADRPAPPPSPRRGRRTRRRGRTPRTPSPTRTGGSEGS